MNKLFFTFILSIIISCVVSKPGYLKFPDNIEHVVLSPQPKFSKDIPLNWDWRSVNNTNYGSPTLNQQAPNVCGSCWAEAATSSLSDRYAIATQGKLRIQLSPQILLNWNSHISGGSCNGGDDLKAFEFIHRYGIVDDTCQPFIGLNWLRGFEVAAMTKKEDVQSHQCFQTAWTGISTFVPIKDVILYGADEFGSVLGEEQMIAEIYYRGPISCSLNSEAWAFDQYHGGIISCPKTREDCVGYADHVVVISGFGVDKTTGMKYWVGRNSYGTSWGEGAGGGWFRIERGNDTLMLESNECKWATPSQKSIDKALKDFDNSLAKD